MLHLLRLRHGTEVLHSAFTLMMTTKQTRSYNHEARKCGMHEIRCIREVLSLIGKESDVHAWNFLEPARLAPYTSSIARCPVNRCATLQRMLPSMRCTALGKGECAAWKLFAHD